MVLALRFSPDSRGLDKCPTNATHCVLPHSSQCSLSRPEGLEVANYTEYSLLVLNSVCLLVAESWDGDSILLVYSESGYARSCALSEKITEE